MKTYFCIKRCAITVFLILFLHSLSHSQCGFKTSFSKTCRGVEVHFDINPASLGSKIKWEFGDGNSSYQNTPSVSHIYDTFGIFTTRVTTYNSNNTIKCTQSLSITVYDNPVAKFMTMDSIQCFMHNNFCFANLSKPGKFNGAPIIKYSWDLGDGGNSTVVDPCYSYAFPGSYNVKLTVWDSNNCYDTFTLLNKLKVLKPLEPKFTMSYTNGTYGCPTTDVIFTNKTDSNGKNLAAWYWDFGNGETDSSSTPGSWYNSSPTVRTYTKDGRFSPSLTMIDKYGCKETHTLVDGVRNISYYFDITKSENSAACWENNQICFTQKPRPGAYYWLWNFDDPPSMMHNNNDETWDPCHNYTTPGFYNITLKIWEPNCIRDTTFCAFIPLKGPMAMINLPPPPAFPRNDCVQAKSIPLSAFHAASSACWNPNADPIQYVTRKKVTPYSVGIKDSFCNAIIDSANIHISRKPGCSNSPIIHISIPLKGSQGSITLYDNIQETTGTWTVGSPLPKGFLTGDIYYPKSGQCNSQAMHDTDIYVPDCQGPNLVRFTNNSMKYRLYYAIDDDPTHYAFGPSKTPDLKFDQCANPSYPWASDSMQYFWTFNDPYANNCTSTINNPDINCKYSTEIQPTHLYKQSGCYTAKLRVTDTVTNCISEIEQHILMEKPDAGWDVSVYGKWKGNNPAMDWSKQIQTSSSSGRRGMILNGIPCAGQNYPQKPDFTETLPSCDRQTWWMVFDSASQCDPNSICNEYTYLDLDGDGIREDTQKHSSLTCGWIDQTTFMTMGGQWVYANSGWKTIGLILKTGDCKDTFWYHHYKYIADLNAQIKILNPLIAGYPIIDLNNGDGFRLCSPHQAIITPNDTDQIGIADFKVIVNQYFGAPWTTFVSLEDSFKNYNDTIYRFCHQDSFTIDPFTGKKVYHDCFLYPEYAKKEKVDYTILQQYLNSGFLAKDTMYELLLNDTLFMKSSQATGQNPIDPEFSLSQPGKYQLITTIRNIHGCAGMTATRLFAGHFTDFYADDTTICYTNGGNNVTFQHFVRYFWLKIFPTDPDLNPNEYWVDPENKLGLQDHKFNARTGTPPAISEKVEWNFGDGTGWHHHKNLTDTFPWKFHTPGNYDISMRTTDSNGCVQVLTKKGFISVMGVRALFDTVGSIGTCTPQTISFNDQSSTFNDYKYTFDKNGQVKDSVRIDSIVGWTWNFGDNLGASSISYLRNLMHTYINNGKHDVSLIVRTVNGCIDTIKALDYINIIGPEPKFWLFENGKYKDSIAGCAPLTVTIKDYSKNVLQYELDMGTGMPVSLTPHDLSSDTTFILNYNTPGTYNITLKGINDSVYDPSIQAYKQCWEIYGDSIYNPGSPTFTVNVLPGAQVKFTGDTLICSGDVAHFIDQSDTGFTSMTWDWGDGSPVQTVNPGISIQHAFNNPIGTVDTVYIVELVGNGSACSTGPGIMPVQVKDAFAYATVKGTSPPQITLGNNSIVATPSRYKWTIEGLTSSGPNYNLDYFHEEPMGNNSGDYTHDFGTRKGLFKACLWAWVDGLGCTDTSCFDLHVDQTITVSTIESSNQENTVFVYPNPASDKLNVYFNNPQNKEYLIRLYNPVGKVIEELNTDKQYNTIDISDQSEGIYIIRIESGDETESFRIVK